MFLNLGKKTYLVAISMKPLILDLDMIWYDSGEFNLLKELVQILMPNKFVDEIKTS